jgi:hypothetical protein
MATTCRNDSWANGPIVTFLFISTALVYMTWAAFQAEHYYVHAYLSPLYSPVIFQHAGALGAAPSWHVWVGDWPTWLPAALPLSPALVILPFPGSFRFTCYYYRKAYYRSFAGSPAGCWVNPAAQNKQYKGETGLMIIQNLHRYAMYFALAFLPILAYDAIVSFSKDGQLGIGVGSLVLTINFCLLASYTFGCHSFRHMVGGRFDTMAGKMGSLNFTRWKFSTWFNERHKEAAWVSLFWVSFTDFYVRMVSMGVITDFNTWD